MMPSKTNAVAAAGGKSVRFSCVFFSFCVGCSESLEVTIETHRPHAPLDNGIIVEHQLADAAGVFWLLRTVEGR